MLLSSYASGLAVGFGVAAGLTPVVAAIARRLGLVASPREDRWHRTPTALLGGVAILLAFLAAMALLREWDGQMLAFLAGAAVVFLVGLADDVRGLSPAGKLLGQLAAGVIVVAAGSRFSTGLGIWADWALTLFWVVGIINAFNLLDNMDGLAAGTAAIAGLLLFWHARGVGSAEVGYAALVLSGACLGFLIYNFNPARVFMGDCGSLFLGYAMAVLTLQGAWTRLSAANLLWSLAGPVMFLTLPIVDTALVSLVRTLHGRPVYKGGKDHISHRLVAVGLSERQAVLVLYGVSLAFGLLGASLNRLNLPTLAVLFVFMTLGLVYLAAFLARVPAYGPAEQAAASDPGIPHPQAVAMLRRLVVGVADLVVLVAAYLAAYLLRFDGALPPGGADLVARSLPVVLPAFLGSFWFFGLYRSLLRYTGVYELIEIFKAIATGAALSVAGLTFLFRFEGYPRTVFVIYVLILCIFIPLNRFFLRGLRQLFAGAPSNGAGGAKVVIYGAGDAGEMVLRELLGNRNLHYKVMGFLDDDPAKQGFRIHGIPVVGSLAVLEEMARRGVEEVIVAMPSAPSARRQAVLEACRRLGLRCRVVDRLVG